MADFTKGWVSLLRSIQDNFLWKIRPYDKARAWVDMILTANHKNNKIMIGNRVEKVDRGSFITSQRKLSERWGWSRNTVRTFLALLEKEKMIALKTTNELSHLTILNYNDLQQISTHDQSHKRATFRATPEPPLEHKQQCNNDNNVINNTIIEFFDYFLLKTKKHYRLTDDRRALIKKKLDE